MLEEPVEPAATDERSQSVHVADIDQDGAFVGRRRRDGRVAERAEDRRGAGVHEHGVRVALAHRLHASHPGRGSGVDHAAKIATTGQ